MIAALLASLALSCPAPVFADDGAQIAAVGHDWFVCSGGAARRFYTDFPGVKLSAFRRFGHRIAFAIDFPNESHTAGYVDERTGVMELASAPQLSTLQAFAVDGAGGVVQLSRVTDGTSQITYAPNAGARLLAPVVLARGDVDPASLAVAGETVTWSGGSARLPVFGCASGETRYAAGATRIFAADAQVELYFCSAAVRTPKRLSLDPHTFGDELHVFGASGPRLLLADLWSDYFITGWDAAWIDLRNGAYHAAGANFGEVGYTSGPLPFGPIDGMAVGSDGAIALIERPAGRHRQLIAYARFGGGRLGRLRALARIVEGNVVASSLRLAHGKVTWRTSSGRRSAVPTRARG